MHGVVSETVDTRWNWHRTRDAGALMHSACKSRMVPELRAGSHRPGTQTHERCRSLTGRCFGPYAVVSSCPQQQQRRCFFLSSAAAAAPLFLLVLSSSSAVVSSCPQQQQQRRCFFLSSANPRICVLYTRRLVVNRPQFSGSRVASVPSSRCFCFLLLPIQFRHIW
jgi:hypothetical protein